jgi:hypothetical protein
VLIFFLLFQTGHSDGELTPILLLEKITLGGLIFASLFIVNFIVKKNGLSKDNSYTILFYLLFMLFFPSVMDNINMILANFFILFALRRLMSLHSLKAHKEKIFDASFWIFVAALFHFWSILFIILVFISIFFHVSRDYRNWLLPFIAFFAAIMAFGFFALIFDETRIAHVFESMKINIRIDYFTNIYQNLAISLYAAIAVFFIASLVLTYSTRPLMLHSSYKKIIMAFLTAVAVYVISSNKSNDLLLFTIAPLAMMATSHIEVTQLKWQKEVVLAGVILCSLISYFTQL